MTERNAIVRSRSRMDLMMGCGGEEQISEEGSSHRDFWWRAKEMRRSDIGRVGEISGFTANDPLILMDQVIHLNPHYGFWMDCSQGVALNSKTESTKAETAIKGNQSAKQGENTGHLKGGRIPANGGAIHSVHYLTLLKAVIDVFSDHALAGIFYLVGFGLFCIELLLSFWVLAVRIIQLLFSFNWLTPYLFTMSCACTKYWPNLLKRCPDVTFLKVESDELEQFMFLVVIAEEYSIGAMPKQLLKLRTNEQIWTDKITCDQYMINIGDRERDKESLSGTDRIVMEQNTQEYRGPGQSSLGKWFQEATLLTEFVELDGNRVLESEYLFVFIVIKP
ncbi:hypothetical protein LXL04_005790 [Taraxacum kok-saghyz]